MSFCHNNRSLVGLESQIKLRPYGENGFVFSATIRICEEQKTNECFPSDTLTSTPMPGRGNPAVSVRRDGLPSQEICHLIGHNLEMIP